MDKVIRVFINKPWRSSSVLLRSLYIGLSQACPYLHRQIREIVGEAVFWASLRQAPHNHSQVTQFMSAIHLAVTGENLLQ